jgi:hypothetical protein
VVAPVDLPPFFIDDFFSHIKFTWDDMDAFGILIVDFVTLSSLVANYVRLANDERNDSHVHENQNPSGLSVMSGMAAAIWEAENTRDRKLVLDRDFSRARALFYSSRVVNDKTVSLARILVDFVDRRLTGILFSFQSFRISCLRNRSFH